MSRRCTAMDEKKSRMLGGECAVYMCAGCTLAHWHDDW
jgi:hypothetical protein